MKLVQFYIPQAKLPMFDRSGVRRVGIVKNGDVLDLTSKKHWLTSINKLLDASYAEGIKDYLGSINLNIIRQGFPYEELDIVPDKEKPHLLMPIDPPEIWGVGLNYKNSVLERDERTLTGIKKLYKKVYDGRIPELFIKGYPRMAVGPNDYIGIRKIVDESGERHSKETNVEPELVVVYGYDKEIIGFTLGNDQTASDLENKSSLYLPQSKSYNRSFSFGPCIITLDEVDFSDGKGDLDINLKIKRDGKTIFQDSASTSDMKRTLDELTKYLYLSNSIPPATALSTGTGIIPNVHLIDGDKLEISNDLIGILRNTVINLD